MYNKTANSQTLLYQMLYNMIISLRSGLDTESIYMCMNKASSSRENFESLLHIFSMIDN